MNFTCPVCFFDRLPYPAVDYHICPCCGTEFGNDDAEYTYEELRDNWIANGAHWFYEQPPAQWNAWAQLARASYGIETRAASAIRPNKGNINAVGLVLQVA